MLVEPAAGIETIQGTIQWEDMEEGNAQGRDTLIDACLVLEQGAFYPSWEAWDLINKGEQSTNVQIESP